jgi:hypothetical protein
MPAAGGTTSRQGLPATWARGYLPYELDDKVRNAEVPTAVEWKGLLIATSAKMLKSHETDKP